MGIKLNLIDNGKGAEILFFGTVHGKEIIQARNEIYDISHKITRFKYHIFNKLHCTEYNVTANDIASIAALDIQASKINPNVILAIIESEYLQFNLTDAWLAYVEDHIAKIKTFKDRCSAIAWIKSNLNKTKETNF